MTNIAPRATRPQTIAVTLSMDCSPPGAERQASHAPQHLCAAQESEAIPQVNVVHAAFVPCALSASLRANQASSDACSASSTAANATTAAPAASHESFHFKNGHRGRYTLFTSQPETPWGI